MNILENDFGLPEEVDAEYVTSQGMSAIWDMCIEPMHDQLSDEDRSLIGIIGVTLQLVAHKAKCYEELQKGNAVDFDESDFSRN